MTKLVRSLFQKKDILEEFASVKRILHQIDRLYQKASTRGRMFSQMEEGVTIATIALKRKSFARTLAREIRAGSYEFKHAEKRIVRMRQKERVIYVFSPSDLIVHGVMAAVLGELSEELLSDRVFSYRKGLGWWNPINEFSAFVQQHVRERPEVKERGLFVLRRDVSDYSESIPIGQGSPFWETFRALVRENARRKDREESAWSMVERAFRPAIVFGEGAPYCNRVGIPTGSPLNTLATNLYLRELDGALESVDGAFYARFGDDFLFAHPDERAARAQDHVIDEIVSSLGLTISAKKKIDLFFNGAGRASESWEEADGSQTVYFLGCNINFDGTVSLQKKEFRKVLREVRKRIYRTKRSASDTDPSVLGPALCEMINNSFSTQSPVSIPSTPLLLRCVSDRTQLRQLDYEIARAVAEEVSGMKGDRAFRTIPYRTICSKWGLASLCQRRNSAGSRP